MARHAIDEKVSMDTEYRWRRKSTGEIFKAGYEFYGGEDYEQVKRSIRKEYGEWETVKKEEVDG